MHLIHLVSSNRWAGTQRYACDICRHYKDAGMEVTAVTRDARAVDEHFREAGVPLHHAPLHGLMDIPSAMILARMLRRIPRGGGAIHVHTDHDAFTALLAKRLARRPDILTVETHHTVAPARITPRIYRLVHAKVDAHIFVSEAARASFFSPWPSMEESPVPQRRVSVIHNSLYIPDCGATPEPDRGPLSAICHGPIAPGKGIENAIEALARIGGAVNGRRLRLRIVGPADPDYLDILRRHAMRLGVMESIDWKTGRDADLATVAESHFAIHPSTAPEGCGIPNLLTMAAGRAQICTAYGAQTEYLADGVSALFVPPGNPDALADAMRRLAADPDLRRSLAANALGKYRSSLSWRNFITRLEKIYTNG